MFQVLIKEFKDFLQDKANVFFVLLFPSIMVFLLGNLLTYMDNSDNPIGAIRAQYIVETSAPGDAAVRSFLEEIGNHPGLELTQAASLEDAKARVASGELSAAVVFREPLRVELFEGADSTQNRALRSVFRSFSRTAAAVTAVASEDPGRVQSLTGMEAGSFVQQKDLGVNRTMIDYYAVAMTAMILFMGGIGGASAFQEERRLHTLKRVLISPKNKTGFYVQKMLGALPTAVLQVLVVMLASTVLFGAHYAATWGGNLLLFSMFVMSGLAVVGVCGIIGLFIRSNPMMVIMPVLWIAMFFSGTFSKEIFIKGVTELSPIYQVQNAAFDLTVFGRGEKAFIVLAVSAVIFVASIAAGALIFQRKAERI